MECNYTDWLAGVLSTAMLRHGSSVVWVVPSCCHCRVDLERHRTVRCVFPPQAASSSAASSSGELAATGEASEASSSGAAGTTAGALAAAAAAAFPGAPAGFASSFQDFVEALDDKKRAPWQRSLRDHGRQVGRCYGCAMGSIVGAGAMAGLNTMRSLLRVQCCWLAAPEPVACCRRNSCPELARGCKLRCAHCTLHAD